MPRGENRSSVLLSREENEQVFSLIGPKCQSLATAVVQLFTTEDPSHSKWKKKDTGVLCLIKDNAKRSYFFRIYCLYRRAMIWEQEVYLQIEYKNPRPFLHTFEAEEYMAAFNFANENEADILRNILLEKIELRKIRREERRQRQSIGASVPRSSGSGNAVARHNGAVREMEPPPLPPQQPPPQAQPQPQPPPSVSPQMFPPKTNNALGTYTLKSNKKLKRGKLTKADIGMPLDFKHVSHVGWDANKGFDLDKAPNADELRSFFTKAGVSETQLQDQETREFIYDFIESHGGFDAVKEDLHNVKLGLPPPPAAAAPPVPSRGAAPPHPPHPPHPPAPPSRAPPPPPARAQHAPPAHRVAPPRPAQPTSAGPPSVPPPPPPGAAPPPPPPPIPACTGAPPPPPPPAPPAPPPAPLAPPAPPAPPPMDAGPDPRAALMESIRSGNKSLRRVEAAPKPVAEDGRSNLLSEIRQGIELRPVSRSDSSSGGRGGSGGGSGGGGGSGLAEALQRALEERSRAIHSDSDDDMSDATTSDGEWDD